MKCNGFLTEEQEKALKAVQKINNELHDKYGWNHYNLPIITISIASYRFLIIVNVNNQDFNLYDSLNETRLYYEKSNKFESFYQCIKRRFRKIKKNLNEIII